MMNWPVPVLPESCTWWVAPLCAWHIMRVHQSRSLDEADVRFLPRYLNIANYRKALDIICQYYPLGRFPQKTLYALEEMVNDLVPD